MIEGKNVFFFGAGFSKAITSESKTLQELTEYVTELLMNENSTASFHYKNFVPDTYKDNIEVLMTYLSSALPYKRNEQRLQDKALYTNLTNKIADFFYSLKVDYGSSMENLKNVCRSIWDNDSTCITLNYDTILEFILREYIKNNASRNIEFYADDINYFYKCQLTHPLSLDGSINIINANSIISSAVVNVVKLHGSINWYTDNKTDTIFYYPKRNIKNKHLEPFIIPPVMDKMNFYNMPALDALWYQAYSALESAENIFIIGFSFPKTDISMHYLFKSALNNSTKDIYVVNIDKSLEFQEQYNNIFKGHSIHYELCCEKPLEKLNELFTQ